MTEPTPKPTPEQTPDTLERLEFSDVKPGDTIHFSMGSGDDAWVVRFEVQEVDGWPTGILTAMMPDGTPTSSEPFTLHGCGRWTNRRQNPVQRQELAFTPYYDGLIAGSFMWGVKPGTRDRLVFDNPGQELTSIIHERLS